MLSRDNILTTLRRYGSSGDAFLRSMSGVNECEESSFASWVIGDLGGKFLDFGSFAVFLFGHSPQEYIDNITRQLNTLPGTTRAFLNAHQAKAYEALASLAPSGMEKVMLLNSGAEAVEAALKLALVKTGRSCFMHLANSYHGKTCGALALTDAAVFRQPFAQLISQVMRVIPRDDEEKASAEIKRLRPAAVFVEPIQGEGGVYELRDSFLQRIRQTCSEVGSLLISDEIQTGLGRTGSLWAIQKSGVIPDIILSGKALGGGIIPVAALIAHPAVFRPFDQNPTLHSSTLAANPLACIAVKTTAEVLKTHAIPQKAKKLGEKLSVLLNGLCCRYPKLFGLVSGRGLMLGLHCCEPKVSSYFIRNCLSEHLIVTPCLSRPTVIRISPPATIGEKELGFARKALVQAAEKTMHEVYQT